jgi:hypothetical protein
MVYVVYLNKNRAVYRVRRDTTDFDRSIEGKSKVKLSLCLTN